MDLETENKLKAWGLSMLIDPFKEEMIDCEALLALNADHIATLVKPIGLRAKLLKYINLEKKDSETNINCVGLSPDASCNIEKDAEILSPLMKKSISTASTVDLEHSDLLEAESSKNSKSTAPLAPSENTNLNQLLQRSKKFCQSSININLVEILNSDLKGKAIRKVYEERNILNAADRKFIVDKLIKSAMLQTSNYELKSIDFIMLAETIQELFPSELVDTYYIPRGFSTYYIPRGFSGAKHATGKLVQRYHNYRNSLYKEKVIQKKSLSFATMESLEMHSASTSIPSEDMLRIVDKLKTNTAAHFCDVESPWKETSEYRLTNFKKTTNVKEHLNEWAALQQPFGHKLLNLDFSTMYPGKENCLLDCWNTLSVKIIDLLRKTSTSIEVQLLLDSVSANSGDLRDLMIFKLIPKLCPQSVVNSGKKKATWHPSLADSQDAFILHVKDQASLSVKIEQIQKKLHNFGDTLQPFTICLGSAKITSVLIYNEGVYYKADSVLDGMDSCFKLFQVLNLKYPSACSKSWCFMQRGIFKILTKWDNSLQGVSTLINDLKL